MPGCGDCCAAPRPANRTLRRVLWAALILNGLMFLVEMVAGLLGRSVALQADALDFLGDAGNYGLSLFVLGMGIRARATAALVKGATMGAFGLWVVGATAVKLVTGTPPAAAVMGVTAFVALGVNILVALLLYRFRDGDSNLRSVWLCSRNDALGNLAVIAAAGGVALTGAAWPDVAVAALIAGLALSAAASVIRQALGEIRAGETLPAGARASPEYAPGTSES